MSDVMPADDPIAAPNYLIVNADDFGQSAGVTRGIVEAHEQGIVTSTSLMVRWPAAPHAADHARTHPDLAVGLHLDFGEWAFRDGEWSPLYQVVDVTNAMQVRREAFRQLDLFRELIGTDPSHVDSHQHCHLDEPLRSVAVEMAEALGVPLRHCSPRVQYCGNFYGQSGEGEPYDQGIEVAALIEILRGLPPGITELACHPGYPDGLDTMYRDERVLEIRTLCDPRIRQALADLELELVSFRQLQTGSDRRNAVRS